MTKRLMNKLILVLGLMPFLLQANEPLRLAIAGLVHGHASGFLRGMQNRPDVKLIGIWEPDVSLHRSYGDRFKIPPEVFFTDLATMLDRTKPEAVAAFTNTF